MLARRKRVVRMRVAQLGDAADVAGVELGNLDALLTLRDREVVQLLGATARDVVQLVAVGDRAGEEPEEGDVTDVWLGHRLEDVGDARAVILGVNLDGRVPLGALERCLLYTSDAA